MAVCPKCKAVIKELYRMRTGRESSRFFINEDEVIDCDEEEFDEDRQMDEYECPECGDVLFEDWEKAEEFLKDKDELKELVAEKIGKIKDDR